MVLVIIGCLVQVSEAKALFGTRYLCVMSWDIIYLHILRWKAQQWILRLYWILRHATLIFRTSHITETAVFKIASKATVAANKWPADLVATMHAQVRTYWWASFCSASDSRVLVSTPGDRVVENRQCWVRDLTGQLNITIECVNSSNMFFTSVLTFCFFLSESVFVSVTHINKQHRSTQVHNLTNIRF